ncbi:ABC transporter [Microbacterium sp. CH12i]|uniref:c-type cytochrome biogenesis protein CcsB n=1 Tax=Microbacterium sp. CH12i TaxID=1479651 RepID=UPI000462000A|nr:c-type cytochrome biogenesis protein CcsB [Microbacterium sp. CH12i]KDA04949.1 ABC transporter [Microbacterium sp. CH12i]
MPDFDSLSILFLWTAIAIYAAAFIAYAFDLARRSEVTADARLARELELVGAATGSGLAGSSGSPSSGAGAGGAASATPAKPRYLMARIGTTLTGLGFLFHLAATVLRGIAAERVPWANLYEFAMTGTLLIMFVYLLVNTRMDLRFLGTFITGLVILLMGTAALSFYVGVVPLMDPLKSVWLVIHVFVASLGTAFFALAGSLSVLQLMQSRRERRLAEQAEKPGPRFLGTLPGSDKLEGMAFRFAIVGFIFWTFTLIAGSVWAQDAWGRYWGFDVKETWTFIVWVLYAGYIHARATRGWRGNPSAWLAIVGFTAVIFNFTIVNVFFKGLHAYSGLS